MVTLRPHQLEALDKIKNGCVLCGGTGSGKSLTALSYFYLKNGGNKRALTGGLYSPMHPQPLDLYIITTARKRDTFEWEKEMAPFLLSTDRKVNKYRNLVIVDSWNNIPKYVDVSGAFFIFDEQRVVGKGVWVKSFLKIAKRNNWILLSATPGDKWEDYAPLFVANGFYKNRSAFFAEHAVYRQFSKFPEITGWLNEKKLRAEQAAILIDMPFDRPTERHQETIPVQYDRITYRDIMRRRWDIWKDEPIENASGLCLALRKVVNLDMTRQIALLELVEKHPKCIIFYNFDCELEILRQLEYGTDVAIAEWNGHKHEPIPDTDKWVYLVQYTAGCEGWNCTKTDTIIFYSQNYSYKVMEQAMGRIDRMNTPFHDLYYYHLKSQSSIDIAIGRALANKKEFNERRFVRW